MKIPSPNIFFTVVMFLKKLLYKLLMVVILFHSLAERLNYY